jgi:adenosylcobinamide-phosphate synthase
LTICALALLIEAAIGYPQNVFRAVGHPVTWMGAMLSLLDTRLNRDADSPASRRAWGAVALGILLTIAGFVAVTLQAAAFATCPRGVALIFVAMLASPCLAQRSLETHVRAVADALDREGLQAARRAVGAIVGRDTAFLDEPGVARAAIESLAENFADGVVAPAVWLAVLGLPGAALYKAVNTADSMIGHRTPRHAAFGFCAAKLDDVVNWPAARFAAVCLVVAALLSGAAWRDAWRVMWRDSGGHASPNAGWPEAAMAGALGIRLGGPRIYAGQTVMDGFIGNGSGPLDGRAIRRALRLYRVACGVEIALVVGLALILAR